MIKIKVIFLDIDGVLNPLTNIYYKKKNNQPTSSYFIKFPGDKIYRLKRICDCTKASVVISSSWRIGFNVNTMEPSKSYKNICNQLIPYGINIIGWTPLHQDRNRGREIAQWLDTHNDISNYIIIDDEVSDILPLHRGRIVKTTSMLGLQDIHVNIAINLLK